MTKEEAEKAVEEAFQAYDMHEWERERWLEKYPELGERMWDEKHARLKTALIEAVRKAERERTSAVRDELIEMVWQFAYRNGEDDHSPLTTGGLSALESAFRFLGLPDPCTVDELNRIADAERARSSEEAGSGG